MHSQTHFINDAIRNQHTDAERLAQVLTTLANTLNRASDDATLLMAARAAYAIRTQIDDLERWAQAAAKTSHDPAAVTLLHRVQVLGQVLDAVTVQYQDRLARGWALLKGDNGHEPDSRSELHHDVRIVNGGAPGLGKRA